MNTRAKKWAARIGKGLIAAIRFSLYVLLLLLGRLLQPIANFAIVVGLVVFLFCLFVRPDLTLPMWAGVGLAVAATVVSVFYEAALSLVAPAGVVIVREV